ncbi:hypothetical protein A9Q86_15795 [Flavobacteriales bacterium 33_180_T64]|nr:hypothetical protein A9Q86_15795 [Flavobacteriales bacterium 33_180_T64]
MKRITFLLFALLSFSFGFSQTFTDSGGPYDIQGSSATCGTANALDLPLTVSGVGVLGTTNSIESVTMNITHSFVADLEFSLVDPTGTVTIILMMDNGAGGDNLTNTVFSDFGVTSISDVAAGDAPFTGTYSPIEALAAFNTAGINADGDWRLLLCDDAGGDTGMVDDWSITFGPTPNCPNPNGLTANNVGGFSADLSWNAGGSESLWNIELIDITAGGTQTMAATSTGVTNPFAQTGLTPSNDYEYYVQADCVGNGTSIWIGPFAFSTTVACPDPTVLSASNITANSADLSWIGGSEILWNIELVDLTAGGTQTMTATATGVGNPYNQTGLVQNNAYEFYAQADCNPNGNSNWVGPFAFTTACDAIAAPYSENFETFTVSAADFTSENCWSGNVSGDGYNWEVAATTDTSSGGTGPGAGVSNGNYLFTEATGPGTAAVTELFSPIVDLSTLTVPSLSFDYHMFGDDMGTLDILVNGNLEFTLTGQQQLEDDAFLTTTIDLAAYAGTTVQVTFRGTRGAGFESDMAIDTVIFDEAPTCFAPTNLTATTITDTTANLGWTIAGSEMLWNIEIVDITAGGTQTMTATATGVTNPHAASSLTQNNDYEFYVQADCGGDGTSTWVGPFAFSTLETCPTPSTLTVDNITDSTTDLGWTENGGAMSWNIEIVDITAGGTQTMIATATGVTNPYTATSLTSENAYEFYVQADCGGDVSLWAGPFAFNTTPLPPSCGGVYVDSGGASGGYSASEATTTTITPDLAGDAVTITFTYVDLESATGTGVQDGCYDFLTIYNGPDTASPVLAMTLCGEESGDGGVSGTATSILSIGDAFTSTHPSGALTIVFSSDSSVQETGWSADVTCATLSTEEVTINNLFSYYPNPVNNVLSLRAQNDISSVTILNTLGQVVYRNTPNTIDNDIDMSNLQSGAYFVQVTIGNATKTVRIIKN